MRNRIAIFGLLTAVLLGYGMYQALVAAPTERTMGDVQRIFYIHVPSAWVAFVKRQPPWPSPPLKSG